MPRMKKYRTPSTQPARQRRKSPAKRRRQQQPSSPPSVGTVRAALYSPGKSFLSALYNGIVEAVLAVNVETRHIVYWNHGAETMFGHTREEVLERTAEFLHPKDAAFQRMYEISTPIIQEKGHWSGEWEFQHRDGRCFLAEVTLTTFLQTDTEDVYAVMVIRDITDRKKTEAVLQRRNTFVHLLQVVAATANESADIHTALRFALTQIGLYTKWDVGHVYFLPDTTGDELIPSDLWYLQDSQQFKKFQTATQKIRFRIGEGFPGVTATTGEPAWIRDVSQDRHFRRRKAAQAVGLRAAFAFPVAINNTVIAVLEFFATDAADPDESLLEVMANIGTQLGTVFERERARAELQEKSALLQLLQEVAVAANESQTIDSALQFAVERVCRHTGWCIGHAYLPAETTPDSLVSSSIWYLGNVKRFSSFRKHTEKRRTVPAGELPQRVLKTGQPEWVMDMTSDPHFSRAKMAVRLGMQAAFAFPVLIENETVAVMEFLSSDVLEPDPPFLEVMANIGTQLGRVFERKRAELQLSTNERLAAIGVTAAKLAHEIGNPLNGMSTTVQLLERQLTAPPATHPKETDSHIREGLHDLASEIQRLRALLDDLRTFVRPQQLCLQPTDLASSITEVLAVVNDTYAEQGIQVKQSFPTDLPLVQADEKRLKQVVLNLCQNAVEAMPSGGCLTVAAGHSQQHVWLEVTDTGEGIINAGGLDIFELFMTTKAEGTGLGLAIVQQIVQAHGGTISYTSQAGMGTTFRVRLPRRRR